MVTYVNLLNFVLANLIKCKLHVFLHFNIVAYYYHPYKDIILLLVNENIVKIIVTSYGLMMN